MALPQTSCQWLHCNGIQQQGQWAPLSGTMTDPKGIGDHAIHADTCNRLIIKEANQLQEAQAQSDALQQAKEIGPFERIKCLDGIQEHCRCREIRSEGVQNRKYSTEIPTHPPLRYEPRLVWRDRRG